MAYMMKPSSQGMLRRCRSVPTPASPCLARNVHSGAVPCAAVAPRHTCSHVPARSTASASGLPRTPSHSRKQTVVVKAGWGAPVEFKPAKIVVNKKVATNLNTIVIDVGAEAGAGYTKPGQFMQVKIGDSKPGFFAIANGPDANNLGALEFLIRTQPGGTAELLCNAAEGTEVMVSPVMGKGFPVDRISADSTKTVLLFASGSGITPLRAVIESGVLDVANRKEVKLYYGTKDADGTAFKELVPQWEKLGVKVQQVYSSDNKHYIQNVLEAEAAPAEPASVGALLCGHKDMCTRVTQILTSRGVPAEKILLNF